MTIRGAVLSAPSYFVLAALLDGPLHGYVIVKRVETLSEEAVRLAAGSLYAVLDRLTEAGLVEVVSEEIVNGRARRYYALTPEGNDTVQAEAVRLATAAKIVTNQALRRRVLNPTVVRPA
ncbi:helix-turn-helix transcriptional regulator [Dactylosporangium sp. AC04546]|uniref:PadR family transcriptional regulator n=1 Tax=Dactylosporangium sp. AC04546 TaxID=2862460 RepID=UPI001EE134C5|nr:helix-turn-helix transcriptional regulator [Dactylosporangium sp. AC04546]WVK88482.1 helix-turn-helix transcriptional regulator [Dactylosporangium sp. AC04546]